MTKNTFNALKKNKFHSGHMDINLWKYPLDQLSNKSYSKPEFSACFICSQLQFSYIFTVKGISISTTCQRNSGFCDVRQPRSPFTAIGFCCSNCKQSHATQSGELPQSLPLASFSATHGQTAQPGLNVTKRIHGYYTFRISWFFFFHNKGWCYKISHNFASLLGEFVTNYKECLDAKRKQKKELYHLKAVIYHYGDGGGRNATISGGEYHIRTT